MSGEPGVKKAEWSWWLSRKADFSNQGRQHMPMQLKNTKEPCNHLDDLRYENHKAGLAKKAGLFSKVTWLDKHYVIYESTKKQFSKSDKTLNHWHTTLPPKTIFFFCCEPTNSLSVLTVAVWFSLLHHLPQQKLYRPRQPCIGWPQASVRYTMKTMGCTGKAMAIVLESTL